MGRVTQKILDDIGVSNTILHKNTNLNNTFKSINSNLKNGNSYALIARKNFFEKAKNISRLKKIYSSPTKYLIKKTGGKVRRNDALKTIKQYINEKSAIVTSTGYISREIYSLGDSPMNFYMVGAMGCSLGISIGIASIIKKSKICCIDGDGALLMRLGVMTNFSIEKPKNLIHVLINNESHKSTGGRFTNSKNIDFLKIADGCGYKYVAYCDSISYLKYILDCFNKKSGPHFLEVKVKDGFLNNLPRPSISPEKVFFRFSNHLKSLK